MYSDKELTITTTVGDREATLRTPHEPADRPALLINLSSDRRTALDNSIVANIFLASGHRVVSFDLPKHGELADGYGSGLQGMANAVKAGEDPFNEIRQVGRALAETAVQSGWAYADTIVAAGTSRGGLAVLHLYSEIKLICAAGVVVPVTHLPALLEFSELAEHPTVRRSNAEALIPELRDRPLMVTIGQTDRRVDAMKCGDFVAKLTEASDQCKPVLVTGPGESHGYNTFPMRYAYQAVAGFLLQLAASRLIGYEA